MSAAQLQKDYDKRMASRKPVFKPNDLAQTRTLYKDSGKRMNVGHRKLPKVGKMMGQV